MGNDWGSSRHGNPDRGRVESSPWAYGQGKGRKRGWESSCHGYGILPCRLNSFTLGNPGSSLSQDFLGTLKIFAAYIISKAIGFSRYVASFGAYIISQATGFLRYVASFGAYIISQATGFLRYAASFEAYLQIQGCRISYVATLLLILEGKRLAREFASSD